VTTWDASAVCTVRIAVFVNRCVALPVIQVQS
jgi:hypothetical protein